MNRGFIGTLCLSVAFALFAGCGGSQPPIGAPAAMSQSRAIAMHAAHGKSWMLPQASGANLLYVSSTATAQLLVFSFPDLGLVGEIATPKNPAGLCSDPDGNIYVTTEGTSYHSGIYEFPRGGSESIKELEDPGQANGCAVDPTSGDLAVVNVRSPRGPYQYGDIAIFKGAEGTPATYYDSHVTRYHFCTYDDAGNLFVQGETALNIILELAHGSQQLSQINLSKRIEPNSIQSYNGALVGVATSSQTHGKMALYKLQVSGSVGLVGHKTLVWSTHDRNRSGVQVLISSGFAAAPGPAKGGAGLVESWKFPKGGRPKSIFRYDGPPALFGVAVSLSPRR